MKQLYILLFFFITYFANAQLETANWYFGQYLGLRFDGDQVIPLSNGRMSTGEGCASISDNQGNLLFYTDGSTVYNKNHEIMLNGSRLLGNSSSTQSAIILPYPDHPTMYVIVTVSADDMATIDYTTNQGFNYYYVDLARDNGFGEVIYPENNKLLIHSSEKVAAVRHINRKDYWIITHFQNTFYSYLLNANGLSNQPNISTIGPYLDQRTYPVNSRGYLSISPNGKKLAIAHLSNLNYDDIPFDSLNRADSINPTNGYFANGYPGYLGVYDFNKGNGRVTNEVILDESGSPYGVQFSPNSKVLYANSDYHSLNSLYNTRWVRGELFNFNLEVPNHQIASTRRLIKLYEHPDTQSPLFTARGALQLALNQKIYYTRDYKSYLSHINNPNNYLNPGFEEIGILFPNASWNITTRYGLPPFISSSFERDILINESDITAICFGEEARFSFTNSDEVMVLSYLWDFGDGTTSTLENPTHIFSQAGNKIIKLQINTAEYGIINYQINLVVYEQVIANAINFDACDIDLDGEITFDLSLIHPAISQQQNTTITFYKTLQEAENVVNSLPNLYLSTQSGEILYARVENELGCFAITTVTLNHKQGEIFQLTPIIICTDGQAMTLELSNYNQKIEDLLNTQTVESIQYYPSLEALNEESNQLFTLQFTNEEVQLFAKVKLIGNECHDIVNLTLTPSLIPNYSIDDQYKCKENTIIVSAPAGFTYQWIGLIGEDREQNLTNQEITIANAGSYQLRLISEDGCEKIIPFNVIDHTTIEIVEVKINHGNSINVISIGNNLQYSLDGVNWQHENVFVNLPVGVYKVYVKNEFGCVVVSNKVSIFQITNFLSPNLDVVNDKWRIPGLEKYDNVKVKIYNRYGKVLVDKTLHFEKDIWDGKYHNKLQPSDSYWYVLDVPGNLIYTGSVLLKNKL